MHVDQADSGEVQLTAGVDRVDEGPLSTVLSVPPVPDLPAPVPSVPVQRSAVHIEPVRRVPGHAAASQDRAVWASQSAVDLRRFCRLHRRLLH